ncbi:hypothetical protein VTO42DRAFT_4001 [Malbranchea cinnamomea]
MTGTSSTQPAPRRKRGRPPKAGGPVRKPVVLDHTGQPRKRGRPRKYPLEEPPKQKETTPTTTTPKKRGRPRKNPVREEPVQVKGARTADSARGAQNAETKKSGRPRKGSVEEQGEQEATEKESEATEGAVRKRGRPRKTTPVGEESPKQNGNTSFEVQIEGPSRRKRGRPPKSDVSETTKQMVDTGQPKRGPGRPRKDEVSTSTESALAKSQTVEDAGIRLEDLVGTYALQCQRVEERWPDHAENMELAIVKEDNGYVAGFNLGIIEGVMLLAPNKKTLRNFASLKLKGEDASSEDVDAGLNENEDDDEEEDEPPAKRVKSSTPSSPTAVQSRRVFFKWRGSEVSTGEIHTTKSEDDNEGHLEFTADKAEFVGFADFPVIGKDCKFTGTKIEGSPSVSLRSWSDYSEQSEDEASKRR